MERTDLAILMHAVLDGQASRGEAESLRKHLAADPAARAEFEQLERLFSELGKLPQPYPPEGLVAAVDRALPATRDGFDADDQLSPHSGVFAADASIASRGKHIGTSPLHRSDQPRSISMSQQSSLFANRKAWIGGGVALAAVALVVQFGFDGYPKKEDVAGTVVAAQRYRAPQAGLESIQLGDQTVAQLMQNDAFVKLVNDPKVRELAREPAFQEALRVLSNNPGAAKWALENREALLVSLNSTEAARASMNSTEAARASMNAAEAARAAQSTEAARASMNAAEAARASMNSTEAARASMNAAESARAAQSTEAARASMNAAEAARASMNSTEAARASMNAAEAARAAQSTEAARASMNAAEAARAAQSTDASRQAAAAAEAARAAQATEAARASMSAAEAAKVMAANAELSRFMLENAAAARALLANPAAAQAFLANSEASKRLMQSPEANARMFKALDANLAPSANLEANRQRQ